MEKALKVENLTKLYKENKGIDNISFEALEGEVVAFIGPSGSGKSTLMKSILDLVSKNSGKISFYGTNLKDNYVDIMNILGYLPDKLYSFKNKAIDLLKYTSKFYDLDLLNEINYYADLFNLNLNKTMEEMSSGELQKLGLIEALYHKPKLLLLDEPTNHLDTKSREILLDLLLKLKRNNVTIILVSHELSFVYKLADKIYLLDEGKQSLIDNNLLKADYKKITLALNQEINLKKFEFKGIKYLNYEKNVVSFIYEGDIKRLIKELNGLDISDLNISNPSIDEILGGLINDL